MRLYPFDLPDYVPANAWWFLGLGLSSEQVVRVARHSEKLGLKLDESRGTWSREWAIGVSGYEDREQLQVGDEVDILVSDTGAVEVVEGGTPPGTRLDPATGRVTGTVTHPGLYSVTVAIGPRVKYDPLGSPGGPSDPGEWIPIDQPRKEPASNLDSFPATVADMDDFQKDVLLAELLAERDAKAAKQSDQ